MEFSLVLLVLQSPSHYSCIININILIAKTGIHICSLRMLNTRITHFCVLLTQFGLYFTLHIVTVSNLNNELWHKHGLMISAIFTHTYFEKN
jgi:hypothetical protein